MGTALLEDERYWARVTGPGDRSGRSRLANETHGVGALIVFDDMHHSIHSGSALMPSFSP